MTILFADIRRSLRLISQADPERAEEILAEAVDVMRDAVNRYGGVVNKVTGDGIMALFGAPLGAEDHPLRACGAALAMVGSLSRRQGAAAADNSPAIEIRVGVNTGEVIVHPTSEYGSVAYDATGAAVHLASRMEQSAGANEVYITAETLRQAAGAVEVCDVGMVSSKDVDDPVHAFRLLRVSSERRPRKPRHASGLTGFVNRTTELRILNVLREQVEGGIGAVIRLTGDAGCGKSRLVEEFVAGLPPGRWTIHRWQGSERHRTTGFRAIADALEGLAGFEVTDATALRKSKLERQVAGLPAEWPMEDRQALAGLVGLAEGDASWQALEPHDRRARLENAIQRLFDNLSQRAPTMFIIEDAHWLDEESVVQFARFFETMSSKAVLAVMTMRSDSEAEAGQLPSGFDCEVQPLSRGDAGKMLQGLLRRGRGVAELEERLLDLTRGNPLFIEECLYSLVDTGAVTPEGGAYALVEPIRELHAPPSIRGLLASRIDRLPDRDKDILQAASVVGLELSRNLLYSLADLDKAEVQASLDRLCRDRFLVARHEPERLIFRHGLTREAVYESIPVRRRVAMHGRLLELIEGWSGDHVELLAHHAIRANAFAKAADYCRRSGIKAFRHDAKEEAVRYFKLGLEAAGRWPAGPERDRALFDLHLDLRNPLFQLAQIDELAQHMAAAGELAAKLHDPARLGRYYPYLSHLAWFTGDFAAALDAVRLTREVAEGEGNTALRARAKFQEGLVWLSQGRYVEAVQTLSDVLVHLESSPDQDQYGLNASLTVTALSYISRAHADRGDEIGARDTAWQALSIARPLKNPFASAFAYIALGYHHLRAGRCAEAISQLQAAFAIADTEDAPLMMPVAASFLAWALADNGQIEESLVLAERAVRKADQIGFRVFQPVRLGIWAHVLLAAGRTADALRLAGEAVNMARLQHEVGAEAHGLKELGRAQLLQAHDRDGRRQATESLAEARRLADEFGMRPLVREIDGLLHGASLAT